jgi:hypothetical protein
MLKEGLLLDLCVEPSATFGKIFPSLPQGQMIKRGAIRDLKAKGLIQGETIFVFGVEYKRYSISTEGKKVFEEYSNGSS